MKYNFVNNLSREFFKNIVASDCQIIAIGEMSDDDEALSELGLDNQRAINLVDGIFKQEGIRISSIENYVSALICDGQIVGGATFGSYNEEGQQVFTFSVAIDSKYQGRGFGKKLVQDVMSLASDQGYFNVWVVNPNMAKLLESMGFETESSRGWSQDSPHMTYYP